MNKDRRKALADIMERLRAIPDIEDIKSDLETIKEEEEEARENLPESLQNGEKGETMQTAIDAMQEVCDALDGFNVEDLIAQLETASA